MSGSNGGVADTTFQSNMNNLVKIFNSILTGINSVASAIRPTGAGAVGAYAMAKCSVAVAYGSTTPGANLTPSNSTGGAAGTLAGTWQCMGNVAAAGDVTLFIRTA